MPETTEFRAEALTVRGEESVFASELSLLVRGGELLGITGPSGSGKTSVLLALAGLAMPVSGRTVLDGRPVSLWQDAALGLVLQNLHLLPVLSAHETVALPMQARGVPRAAVNQRAAEALANLGLGEHGAQLIQELSGGQRQRVAVARAIAGRPELLFADEPASGLDPHWRAVVIEQLVDEARRGAVVIIVSSDPELMERCDQVITLGDKPDHGG